MGGFGSGSFSNTNYEYDPVGNQWTSKAVSPVGMYHALATSLGAKIEVVEYSDIGFGNTLYEYEPLNDTWQFVNSNPPRLEGATLVSSAANLFLVSPFAGQMFQYRLPVNFYIHRKN